MLSSFPNKFQIINKSCLSTMVNTLSHDTTLNAKSKFLSTFLPKSNLSTSSLNMRQLRSTPKSIDNNSVNRSGEESKIKLADYIKKSGELNKKEVKMDHVNNAEIKFYDPPYLAREAPFPNYQALNLNVKGYDFAVLDSFYKYIEKVCTLLEVEVVEAYAMPARNFKIKTYQPFSTNLDKEYTLNLYHRIVRVKNLKSTLAPLLFETVQLNLPEGVQLSINPPTFEEDEFRYVPDLELQDMRERLQGMARKPKNEDAKNAKK